LQDFSEDRWAVQMTVAAITVNAQANSSPKRHEPLQGVGTFNWPPAGAYTWPPLGTFSWPRNRRGLHTFRMISSVLDDLEYSHSRVHIWCRHPAWRNFPSAWDTNWLRPRQQRRPLCKSGRHL